MWGGGKELEFPDFAWKLGKQSMLRLSDNRAFGLKRGRISFFGKSIFALFGYWDL